MFNEISYNQFIEHIKATDSKLNKNCPIQGVLELFNGKWKAKILFELSKHTNLRFGELKKQVSGITNTMLAATLKELEAATLVDRIQYNEIPPHVEYSLTEYGRSMLPIFFEMAKWGEAYYQRVNSD